MPDPVNMDRRATSTTRDTKPGEVHSCPKGTNPICQMRSKSDHDDMMSKWDALERENGHSGSVAPKQDFPYSVGSRIFRQKIILNIPS